MVLTSKYGPIITGHRWLAKLASFDLLIKYKRGKTNTDADLSHVCLCLLNVISELESSSDLVEQLDISQFS